MTTPKTTRKTRTPAGSAAIKTKKIVKRVELPPNPFIHEILDHVEEQKTKAKKIAELRKYRDDSLTAILIWNFDSSVISAVPEGQVPYKENEVPIGTDHTSLRREWKNLFHFIKMFCLCLLQIYLFEYYLHLRKDTYSRKMGNLLLE